MRKIITLLTVVALSQSCKKCGTCTTTTTINEPNPNTGVGYQTVNLGSTTFDACGDEYESANGSSTSKSHMGPLGEVITTTNTTCN